MTLYRYIDLNDIYVSASASTESGETYTESNSYGIYLDNSGGNTFEFLDIRNNDLGVWTNSANNVVRYSKISNNSAGIKNEPTGLVNAVLNWWGSTDGPSVGYRPFLPEDLCTFNEYMEKHKLENPREAMVNRMSEGETCSTNLPKRMIVNYHLKPRKAEKLVNEYGCYDVRQALKEAEDNLGDFKEILGIPHL
ncbi:MAG: right-handed parallel beta-helix repeat-containing protein [Candidatus Bipolaricaulota bacterium]